jgi:histidine triad (HIT) family protein
MVSKEIPVDFIYENDDFVVINDIDPKAPIHNLIISKKHIPTLNDIEDDKINAGMLNVAKKLAANHNVAEDGYRLILNCNKMGGQSVFHIHMHFLAGKQMHGF